jgi:hypothetical protein
MPRNGSLGMAIGGNSKAGETAAVCGGKAALMTSRRHVVSGYCFIERRHERPDSFLDEPDPVPLILPHSSNHLVRVWIDGIARRKIRRIEPHAQNLDEKAQVIVQMNRFHSASNWLATVLLHIRVKSN